MSHETARAVERIDGQLPYLATTESIRKEIYNLRNDVEKINSHLRDFAKQDDLIYLKNRLGTLPTKGFILGTAVTTSLAIIATFVSIASPKEFLSLMIEFVK